MPYYRDVLASAWPDFLTDVGAPPAKLDPQFLKTLQPAEFGLYGRNARAGLRNQAEDTRRAEKGSTSGLRAPKFLSEKARESVKAPPAPSRPGNNADEISSRLAILDIDSAKSEVPLMYRNVEMKYSKFGVDDFDFELVPAPAMMLPERDYLLESGIITKLNTPAWRSIYPIHTPTLCCK